MENKAIMVVAACKAAAHQTSRLRARAGAARTAVRRLPRLDTDGVPGMAAAACVVCPLGIWPEFLSTAGRRCLRSSAPPSTDCGTVVPRLVLLRAVLTDHEEGPEEEPPPEGGPGQYYLEDKASSSS